MQAARDREMRYSWLMRIARISVPVIACLVVFAACGSAGTTSASERDHVSGPFGHQVLLMPAIQAGLAGWCMAVDKPRQCLTPQLHNGPIMLLNRSMIDEHRTVVVAAVTTSEVAAVSINHRRRVPTRTGMVLPDGLRAAVVEEPGSRGSQRTISATAFDKHGRPIVQRLVPSEPLLVGVLPFRKWKRPAPPVHGICEMSSYGDRSIEARWGSVATKLRSYISKIGGALVSCAWTEYDVEGWPLEGAVLLDAARPGSMPPPLPGMKPLAGHPGVFEAPIASPPANGEAVARRIPHAWLVVAFGEQGSVDLRQRLAVLGHLHAKIHL
jgi:hypothetical protein